MKTDIVFRPGYSYRDAHGGRYNVAPAYLKVITHICGVREVVGFSGNPESLGGGNAA